MSIYAVNLFTSSFDGEKNEVDMASVDLIFTIRFCVSRLANYRRINNGFKR